MKTFIDYLNEQEVTEADINSINESLNQEWTPELESKIDEAVEEFLKDYRLEDGSYDVNAFK